METTLYEIQIYRSADGYNGSWVVESDVCDAGVVPEGVLDYADLQCQILGKREGSLEVRIGAYEPVRVVGLKGIDRQTRGAWFVELTEYVVGGSE